MARKPLRGTVAATVQQYGTGALNIGATRIGTNGGLTRHTASNGEHRDRWEGNTATGEVTDNGGRWPANLILTDPIFDGDTPGVVGPSNGTIELCQSNAARPASESSTDAVDRRTARSPAWQSPTGVVTPAQSAERQSESPDKPLALSGAPTSHAGVQESMGLGSTPTGSPEPGPEPSASGSVTASESSPEPASRSRRPVRSVGHPNISTATTTTTPSPLRSEPSVPDATNGFTPASTGGYSRFFLISKASRSDREPLVRPDGHDGSRIATHPTMKPLDLMRHLVRLVTPPGGTILDCFLGSGTTAIAANAEGFRCIGIEREAEYLEIAVARMAHQPLGLGLDVPA